MKEYHFKILQFIDNGWKKNRERAPHYIFLRKDGEEMKIALQSGEIVRGPYKVEIISPKK